jgi:acyl carrier protein
MASRCQETGDLDRAQRYAGTIRALSRFKDQARVVVCSCRLAAGAWDQAEEEARRIHHHDLREQMLHRCRSGRQGLAASHEAVLSSTVLPDPAVVGQLIAGAWEQRDGERLVALQRLLLDRTRQAGQEAYAAEYRELHGGLEVMLRHLGIDPRAQVLDVRCVNLTRELTGLVATRHTQGRMVDADESLFMSGLVDSLGIAEIAAHISRVGGITLTGTDIVEQDLDSIRKLVAHVRSRIA